MHVDSELVASECEWVHDRADVVVPFLNHVRDRLSDEFDTDVDGVTPEQYHEAVDAVFAEGDLAVNVAAMVALLRDLDVEGDYPGFVVDELLGRELAATLAGEQPARLLAEATFHYADVLTSGGTAADGRAVYESSGDLAGVDDLDAALAAGFQSRLPGWEWTATDSPFGVR